MITFRKINNARYALVAALLASAAMQSTYAFAQLPADAERAATSSASPGRVQEQLEEGTVSPEVFPKVEVRDMVLQQVPPGAENITMTLKEIQLEGVTVYSPAQLEPVYANQLGATITLADVYGIAQTLTNKYRNEGYILTQVIVPPQTIEGGMVKLQVVEGYVDNITVEGGDQESAMKLVRTYASQIHTGNALNVRDLERHLLLINDLPGVEARSILSPSRTQTGAADLRVIVTRDPVDALLAIDNYGSRYLGPLQATAAGSLNSFFGNNETITGQMVVAPDPNRTYELAYFAVSYEQPVWTQGTKVELFASHTDTEPGHDLDPFNVKGRSQFMSAKVEHPFIRARSQNLYGHVLFDWRDVESQNELEPTRQDRIRALRAGGRYEFLDTLIGVGVNAVRMELSQGLNIFGSSEKGSPELTRPFGDPQFTKMNIDAQRLQRISSNLNLLVAARGQWADSALLSSEEFGLGGINFGRGFDPSEVVGDDGVSGKLELQWNKPYQWDFVQDYQLFGFFDAGRVWNDDATTSSQKSDTLTSTGLGIRTDFLEQTKADLAVAFPLNRDVETQNDRDPKVYFSLSRRF